MDRTYFTTGIYSVREAAQLTGVSAGRIRRWLKGYRSRWKDHIYKSPALWRGQWKPMQGSLALGFLDLIEVRFVDAFLKAGVSWPTLRMARERAAGLFDVSHPFCTRRFVTDGRAIFVELQKETGEAGLMELLERQQVFVEIVKPFMKELEFTHGKGLVRWWPMGDSRQVVVDPTRNFGRPIVAKKGVPAEVLAKAAKAAGSLAEVARWYEVAETDIRDAVEFEQQLAA